MVAAHLNHTLTLQFLHPFHLNKSYSRDGTRTVKFGVNLSSYGRWTDEPYFADLPDILDLAGIAAETS